MVHVLPRAARIPPAAGPRPASRRPPALLPSSALILPPSPSILSFDGADPQRSLPSSWIPTHESRAPFHPRGFLQQRGSPTLESHCRNGRSSVPRRGSATQYRAVDGRPPNPTVCGFR
ncbi:tyrosine kinase family protein [Zea mays]|uniref:Tyrosine kinase family protein n=1 Tax=Zea mays TaxID=4577 RepID=A0A1D6E1G5_MAIZE|nr:tyrosine kinase family protein [Zea mays]